MPERYRQLFAHFTDPLFIEDAAGTILEANAAAAALLGAAREELIGKNSADFLAPASLERLSPLLRALRPESRLRLQVQYLGHDNQPIDVEVTVALIPWTSEESAQPADGKLESAYLVLAREITERETLAHELRVFRNAAFHSADGCPQGVFFVTSQNTVARFPLLPPLPDNTPARPLEWAKNLILSAALKSALDRAWAGEDVVLPPAWYSEHAVPMRANISGAMAAVAEESRITEIQGLRQHWLSIALRPLRDDSAVSGIIVQIADVTRARLETERKDVVEDQTVLAMLTSSIHHEINNYLSVIIAQASAMRMSLPQGQLPAPNIGAIIDAGQEAVALLRRSADLLGRIEGALAETDLNPIVTDAGHLLRHMLPDTFAVKIDPGPDVPRVRADARLMRSLILILARHLQTRLIGGTLTVRTFRPAQVHAALVQAGLSIEDTGSRPATPPTAPGARTPAAGHGMEPPSIALARAIARYHRAQLEVLTTAHSTVIELLFPGLEPGARDGAAVAAGDGTEAALQHLSRSAGEGPRPREAVPLPNDPLQLPTRAAGAKRILIADDEENFRTFMGWSLRQQGYEVVLAGNGQEAFERFQESPASFHLAILDAYMPLMGGLETYLRMQVLRPDLPVVFASGFVRGPSVETLIDGCPGPATVLLKPFSSEDLVKTVATALNPPPADEEEPQSEEEVAEAE